MGEVVFTMSHGIDGHDQSNTEGRSEKDLKICRSARINLTDRVSVSLV